MAHSYTKVMDENEADWAWTVWTCNDCGAHAGLPAEVEHHDT